MLFKTNKPNQHYLLSLVKKTKKFIIKKSNVGRVFANGPGDLGSIPGRVIPKTLKIVLDTTQHYKVHIKGKWSNSGKGVAPFPTPRCSSY